MTLYMYHSERYVVSTIFSTWPSKKKEHNKKIVQKHLCALYLQLTLCLMNQFIKKLTHYHYYGIQLSSLSFQAKTVGAPHVVSSFLKLHYKTFTKDFVAIFLISSQCDWCHFCGSYVNIFDYCFLWDGLGYNPRNISQKIQVQFKEYEAEPKSNQSPKSKLHICRYSTFFKLTTQCLIRTATFMY